MDGQEKGIEWGAFLELVVAGFKVILIEQSQSVDWVHTSQQSNSGCGVLYRQLLQGSKHLVLSGRPTERDEGASGERVRYRATYFKKV